MSRDVTPETGEGLPTQKKPPADSSTEEPPFTVKVIGGGGGVPTASYETRTSFAPAAGIVPKSTPWVPEEAGRRYSNEDLESNCETTPNGIGSAVDPGPRGKLRIPWIANGVLIG
jgi:hypothetical protein